MQWKTARATDFRPTDIASHFVHPINRVQRFAVPSEKRPWVAGPGDSADPVLPATAGDQSTSPNLVGGVDFRLSTVRRRERTHCLARAGGPPAVHSLSSVRGFVIGHDREIETCGCNMPSTCYSHQMAEGR